MQMIQVRFGDSMPLVLLCLSNGTIAFAKLTHFHPVIDMQEDNGLVKAEFHVDHIEFKSKSGETSQWFNYSTTYDYKQHPLMLGWLQQQNLQLPQF